MLLIDFSQVMFSNLMANIGPHAQNNIFNEDMLRHMILNSLRSYRQKFCHEYGELIIVCDSHNYWRSTFKEFFSICLIKRKKSLSPIVMRNTNNNKFAIFMTKFLTIRTK